MRKRILQQTSVLTLACLLFATTVPAAAALEQFQQVRTRWRSSESVLLDRDGAVLHRLRTDPSVRRGEWVSLQDISPALRRAIVLSEDQRFHEHSGVDWQAVPAAAWANLWNQHTRGASTLTMQLVGLLEEPADAPGRARRDRRTVVQKLSQAAAAEQLERSWRKDQILEAYLNLVPFRGELVGIDALSRTLFGKAAHGLDEQEAAIAAALVRAPNAGANVIARRACAVLRSMQSAAATPDCALLEMRLSVSLKSRAFDAEQGIAPHLARKLLRVPGTLQVRSSLRRDLQLFAQDTLRRHLRELSRRNVEDGALIVLDNATGEVLAWVGSSGELSDSPEVDGVESLRQPGSALKPFLYAQAIAQRRPTAASLIDDSPASIATASGLYIPQNYDHHFKGWVSVRTALGASLNVPAVRTLGLISPEAFHAQLRAAGLALRESGDYFGYSLALGSAAVSLHALANAYRTLANGGVYSPTSVRVATGARPTGVQAIDRGAAYVVGDILSDTNARARTFGSDSLLATRGWTAVKTGTSKDMRDNWAVGWSQWYTVGVWVGNASGAPMHDVSGTTGAAPVWASVMGYLHRGRRSAAPRPPPDVVSERVSFADGGEASRQEWFLKGTEQSRIALATAAAQGPNAPLPRIISPPSGTIIALDPDIPPQRQRLEFVATASAASRWMLDGRELGRGERVSWMPWPGRHVLQLRDARGRVADEIRLEVRGAGVVRGGAGYLIPPAR